MSKELTLKFDPNTIEHLGISLYSKLPSVLSELISNSWDADAEHVTIEFTDQDRTKEIFYSDDGHGMTFNELNEKYLMIGRNRRESDGAQTTPKGRKVIGKKGLGKLSVFGICDEVIIESTKNGKKNKFIMRIDDIKNSKDNLYRPEIMALDEVTTECSGLKIWLKKIRRKSGFNIKELALGLSKKFLIFDQLDTTITHNNTSPSKVTNELKFSQFNIEFEWELPTNEYGEDFEHWESIKGKVYTLETPIKDTEMKGIYLTSRGKIVNTAGFYGLRDTDQFHTYATGYLEVDFIDDLDVDLISTDRHSLNWEHDVTRELQAYLQKVIKKIGSDWKKLRANKKLETIKRESGIDVPLWRSNLGSVENELAGRILDPILENSTLDAGETKDIINGVMGQFGNATYREYANQIATTVNPDEMPKFLKLMDEWKTVESKQLSELALSRIEVIKQFEEHLDKDTKEVPTLHDFLKKFSWLLDPRIIEFRDEVTYTSLLKTHFPDDKLEGKDRRIDFLCSNALGGILYVIEIKRSKYKVDVKALEQAYEYQAFLIDKYSSQSGFSKVVCYVVGGEKSENSLFKRKEETYRSTGEVFVKTYRELLEQSKEYHREFIDTYDKMKSAH